MPTQHFMRDDLIGVAVGTLLFATVFLPPGYLFGWLGNLLNFRERSWPEQLATSLVLSVSVSPILVFLLWLGASINAVWAFYLASSIFFILFSVRARKTAVSRFTIITVSVWLLVVWFSGIDLQFGNRLFPSVISYDFTLRTAVISGLTRNGLPAQNPLFFPDHAQPLRYHYFWLLLCAWVDQLGGKWVDARQALIASDVWCGWALMATIALYARFFHPAGERGIDRRVKWGIVIVAIAGLDILPNLGFDILYWVFKTGTVYASPEWWNYPVTGFPHATLWVAHHLAGVIACLTGFLVLWWGTRKAPESVWRLPVCCGLCFASSVGLSIYITFTFGIFLSVWGLTVIAIRRQWRESFAWIGTGIVTVACALPYLRSLVSASGSGPAAASAAASTFVLPTIRGLRIFDLVLPQLGLTSIQVGFANLLVLPLNYFLETGAWFALAIVWWKRAWRRRRHLGEAEIAGLTMFAISVLVGTFLRSGVIANNDLGWRSLLIAQVILVVWSIAPLRAWWRLRKRASPDLVLWRRRITVLVALGLCSTVYELVDLRFYLPLTALGVVPQVVWFTKDPKPGRRTFDARMVYEKVAAMLPQSVIVQANPLRGKMFFGLYASRQTASIDAECGSTFGGGAEDCQRMQAELVPLFDDPSLAREADADRTCDTWGIHVLVAQDDDPVFHNPSTWVWTRPAIAESEMVRAVSCGKKNEEGGASQNSKQPLARRQGALFRR